MYAKQSYNIELIGNNTNDNFNSLALNDYFKKYTSLMNHYKRESYYRENNVYFPYEKGLSYYALFLTILGTICNLFSIIILTKYHIKRSPWMRYLIALAIADFFALYQWNLNTFYLYNISKPPYYFDLEELSLVSCRLVSFFAFSSLQFSAWLLSLLSFDRLMVIYSFKWRLIARRPIVINIIIATTLFIILILNSHLLFLNGYEIDRQQEKSNFASLFQTEQSSIAIPDIDVICYYNKQDRSYIYFKWQTAHLLLYCLIPFVIMLICNSIIIYNIAFITKKVQLSNASSIRRRRKMTRMLLLITFSFIILTLPSSTTHAFFRSYLKGKSYRRLVILINNSLLYTSHTINFFLYVLTIPQFRKDCFKVFKFLSIFSINK